MTKPLISVLLTAYNRESYIRDSVESVLAQDFTDFELLIVDDCSTDRTLEIAKNYEARDGRVRVFANDRNLGDYPNRNYAASLARGEFIKYHDSDDVMYPHCLELMVHPLIDELRADFALTSACSWLGGPVPMLQTPELSYSRQFFGGFRLFSGGPGNALFRKAFFESLGRFPMAFGASDYLFWIKAFAVGNALLVPADLYWYRVHPAQEMQESRQQFNLARVDGAMWQMLRSVECPIKGPQLEQAKRNWTYRLFKLAILDVLNGRWDLARHRIRCCGLTAGDWARYLRRAKYDLSAGVPPRVSQHSPVSTA